MTKRGSLLREHWPLVAVFGVAVLARLLVAIAYRPALFFSDSWSYLTLAYSGERFAPDRPSGYSFVLELIGKVSRDLLAVTTLQHLAGLATGVLVYALLVRADVGRALATLAAALVLFNAYAIVLEQTILAEAFFTLAVVASFYLVTGERRSNFDLVASGLLLAGAVSMRSAAVFALPVWIAYVMYRSRWRGLIAVAAVVLPLLLYGAVHEAKTGDFGLTTADGWFLYGRVGEIADCDVMDPPAGTRDLCEPVANSGGRGALYYIWDPQSGANRRFPNGFETPGSSEVLRRFAVSVIEARPLPYLGLVVRDTVRWFVPGKGSPGNSDYAIMLPEDPRLTAPWLNASVRDRFIPGVEPEVHQPAGLARAYTSIVRVPRPLLGLLAILPLALVPLALRGPPGASRHLFEALLLSLSALAMLIGPAATSGFIVRYLVPTVPLIVCAGALASRDLIAWARARRASRSVAPA